VISEVNFKIENNRVQDRMEESIFRFFLVASICVTLCCRCCAQLSPLPTQAGGISTVEIGESENLVVWKTDIAEKCSEIIVTKDHVIFFGHSLLSDDSVGAEKRDVITVGAVDRRNGKILWTYYSARDANWRADLPQTPLRTFADVTNDRVLFLSNDSSLVCLDLSGLSDGDHGQVDEHAEWSNQNADTIWKTNLADKLDVSRTELSDTACRVGGVIVHKQTCYAVTGHGRHFEQIPSAPSFVAVDMETGKIIWSEIIKDFKQLTGNYAGPTLISREDGPPLVVFPSADGILRAYDTENLEQVWTVDCAIYDRDENQLKDGSLHRRYFFAPPTISNELMVVTRSESLKNLSNQNYILAFQLHGKEAPTLKWKWDAPSFAGTFAPIATRDKTIVVKDVSGSLFVIWGDSSPQFWCWKSPDKQAKSLFANALIHDHQAFLPSESGLAVVSIAKTDVAPYLLSVDGRSVNVTPKIDGDHLYAVFENALYCIALSKLHEIEKKNEDFCILAIVKEGSAIQPITDLFLKEGLTFYISGSRITTVAVHVNDAKKQESC
jgi:outer membrane protein assembly factor BamB